MKKLLLAVLALGLCACSTSKAPTMSVSDSVVVGTGAEQIEYREDVCKVLTITDKSGNTVDFACEDVFFANGINSDQPGTYDVRLVYSGLDEKIETVVQIIVE